MAQSFTYPPPGAFLLLPLPGPVNYFVLSLVLGRYLTFERDWSRLGF